MELYTNARFISCEKENRIYTAMAVKGGHIVWLGDESSIPPRYGKAKRVDLGGATVTPAFGDTHMHFGSLCVFENTFYLMDVKNFAEAKAAVRRYADSHRKNKVLMGYGCTANTVAEHRLPEKRDLDDWTERPLMVMKYDGHAAVCNSAMLALLSDKVKSDPGCNTETGWLYQSAFYNGVNEATAYIPTMDIIRGLSGGAEYLASVGIGLVHTVEGVGFANDLDIDMIKILAPGLPQAFRIFFQTMDLKAVKKHGFKRVGGCFKLALDGCFGSEDAALKEPYANDPNNYGVLNYPQERVNEFAIGANREGWQITMHAIGDAAVEQCITAYEAAYADKPWDDARHVMIHLPCKRGAAKARGKDKAVHSRAVAVYILEAGAGRVSVLGARQRAHGQTKRAGNDAPPRTCRRRRLRRTVHASKAPVRYGVLRKSSQSGRAHIASRRAAHDNGKSRVYEP